MSRSWNPLQDLMILQDRMNRLFEDATQRHAEAEADQSADVETADWFPAADVIEAESEYLIQVDLPGIDRSALDINIDNNRLVIKGTRTIEDARQQRVERPRGRFLRTFAVPASVDQSQIAAEYKNGVLSVFLPKEEAQTTKRVEIKISQG
jgi:HSP20 family protein